MSENPPALLRWGPDALLATGLMVLLLLAFHWSDIGFGIRRHAAEPALRAQTMEKARHDMQWHGFLKAAEGADLKAMESLLGENPEFATALSLSHYAHNMPVETVKFLADHKATMTVSAAIVLGRADEIPSLIQANPDALVEMTHSEKAQAFETPFHLALRLGKTDVMELLLKNGADINDDTTDPPLLYAVRRKDVAMVRWLLDHGAVPRHKDVHQMSMLDWAFQEPHKELDVKLQLVELLLRHGADLSASRIERDRLLLLAIQNGRPRLVEALLKAGVDLNRQDSDQRAALHHVLCATTSRKEILVAVLAGKPDLDRKDRWGRNPLDLAEELGDGESADLLRRAGARPTPRPAIKAPEEKLPPKKEPGATARKPEPAPPADPELESERKRLAAIWPHLGLGQNLGLRRTKTTDPWLLDLSDPLGSSTRVRDLSPLKGMKIETLLLSETAVTDLAPLRDMPLRRLDLSGTPVADLAPLQGMKLNQLNLKDSAVKDLSPLKDLTVNELVFSPEKIAKGLEVVRGKKGLSWIGVNQERLLSAEAFWKKLDAGGRFDAPSGAPGAEGVEEERAE